MRPSHIRIAALLILVGAYVLRQRGLFVVYHLLKAFALLGGQR
jgi:hypothetical protein